MIYIYRMVAEGIIYMEIYKNYALLQTLIRFSTSKTCKHCNEKRYALYEE